MIQSTAEDLFPNSILYSLYNINGFRGVFRQTRRILTLERGQAKGQCPLRIISKASTHQRWGAVFSSKRRERRERSLSRLLFRYKGSESVEQLGDRDLLIDALDRLCEHGSHRQILQSVALACLHCGNGIQQGQLHNVAVVQALQSGAGEHAVRSTGMDAVGAAHFHNGLGCVAQRTGGIHHIVKQDAILAANIADDVHNLAGVGLLTALIYDGQLHVQLLCECTSTGHRTNVGRNDNHVLASVTKLLGIVIHKDGVACQIIHGDIKEALDLCSMQIHGQHAVRTGCGEHIGHQLGSDGITGLGLTILTGIAEIGDHSGDTAGRSTLHGVDHDQQLHQAVVDRGAGRLHDEHIATANSLKSGDKNLAIGEGADLSIAHLNANLSADRLCQLGIGVAGENLDILTVRNHIKVPLSLSHIYLIVIFYKYGAI